MVIAHMRQSVSQMKAILLKSEEEIRFLILYEKERLLHEDMADMQGQALPMKFMDIPDEERRGMIRALRWVVDSVDEDWV